MYTHAHSNSPAAYYILEVQSILNTTCSIQVFKRILGKSQRIRCFLFDDLSVGKKKKTASNSPTTPPTHANSWQTAKLARPWTRQQKRALTCNKKELSRQTIRRFSSRSLSLSPMLPTPSMNSKNCSKRPHDRAASGRRETQPATTLPKRVVGRPLRSSCSSPTSGRPLPAPSSEAEAVLPVTVVGDSLGAPVTAAAWSAGGEASGCGKGVSP